METKLKQRVIGAVVLTTLAVIVLPMLLDGSAEDRARVSATIPAPPKIQLKSMSIAEIKQNMARMEQESAARLPVEILDAESTDPTLDTTFDQAANSQTEDQQTEDQQTADQQAVKETYRLDQNDLPVSWTLQLASFAERNNATRLRQLLRDAQFRTYILMADSTKGQVYRVFVGPMLSKTRLSGFAEDIEADFDLKGRIIRYQVEEDGNQLGG